MSSATITITDDDAYTDYDTDDDGLIEIDTAAKLNAVRWDLDGDGAADNASDNASYQAVGAFRIPAVNQCDKAATMGTTEECTGYELTADVDLGVSPVECRRRVGADRDQCCAVRGDLRRRRPRHQGDADPRDRCAVLWAVRQQHRHH